LIPSAPKLASGRTLFFLVTRTITSGLRAAKTTERPRISFGVPGATHVPRACDVVAKILPSPY
jgi:hypothetical protein